MQNHRVRDALKAQGVRGTILLHREILATERTIAPDEAVLWSTNADVTAIPLTEQFYALPFTDAEAEFGVLTVTTKRIVFCPGSILIHQMMLSDLQSIETEHAQRGSVVRVTGVTEGILTYFSDVSRDLDKFQDAVTKAKGQVCPTSRPAKGFSDLHAELRGLKQLLDDDILTQDEFDQKKKQLLDL